VSNHTLEEPNDWWRLHLPMVISLKSTRIPVTHLRYNNPQLKCTSIIVMGGRVVVRHRQLSKRTHNHNIFL